MRPIGLLTAAAMSFATSVAMAAEAKEGMPQLDFKNVLLKSQVVWLVIIFALLYVLLSRWALPKIGNVLEKRASTIEGDLNAARGAKASADAAVAELTAKTREAHAGAQAEIAAAVGAAKAAADSEAAVLNARLDGKAYVVGNALTIADLTLASSLMYAKQAEIPLAEFPHVEAWFGRSTALDGWKQSA